MFKVESTITINAPVNEVYDWMDHPHKHHDWQHSLLDTHVTDEKIVVGRKFMGRRVETHFHEVKRTPNKELRRSGKSGPGMLDYSIEQVASFEEVNGSTKLTVSNEVDAKGALKSAVLNTFQRVAQRDLDASLAHLKELVEADDELHELLAKAPRHGTTN